MLAVRISANVCAKIAICFFINSPSARQIVSAIVNYRTQSLSMVAGAAANGRSCAGILAVYVFFVCRSALFAVNIGLGIGGRKVKRLLLIAALGVALCGCTATKNIPSQATVAAPPVAAPAPPIVQAMVPPGLWRI